MGYGFGNSYFLPRPFTRQFLLHISVIIPSSAYVYFMVCSPFVLLHIKRTN